MSEQEATPVDVKEETTPKKITLTRQKLFDYLNDTEFDEFGFGGRIYIPLKKSDTFNKWLKEYRDAFEEENKHVDWLFVYSVKDKGYYIYLEEKGGISKDIKIKGQNTKAEFTLTDDDDDFTDYFTD